MELRDGISGYRNFIAYHKHQLVSSGVPVQFWETLYHKIDDHVFDAGSSFTILKIEYDETPESTDPLFKVVVSAEDGILCNDRNNIYLIDHAWTYSAPDARKHLRQIPGLLRRMSLLMNIDVSGNLSSEQQIELVHKRMWKYNLMYSVSVSENGEQTVPIWYIMDEFGSAIQHSDTPNFRIVPFLYLPEQITYSVLFPITSVSRDEEVTRDFVESYVKDPLARKALLIPWKPASFLSESFVQEEPGKDYFLEGHVAESLPDVSAIVSEPQEPGTVLKVYTDYNYVYYYLNDPRFELTENKEEANILWYLSHFKDYKELSEASIVKYVNQFPYEHVITVKDLLSIVCRRKVKDDLGYDMETLETFPSWLPTTYNLKTELVKFVSYFQHREKLGLDNIWICKPWNLARGIDIHVTDNLDYIMRLPLTGPKIAQKYMENPVLFERPDRGHVKFDIRYVILLKCVQPLEVYVYRNFFLRFANKPFDLDKFDDYETHFTVMNYSADTPLYHKTCAEFLQEFNSQYPDHEWKAIEERIFSMIREIFEAATSKEPPCGISHNPQSRALYAIDLMLAWHTASDGQNEMQPKLLEVNWTPDCQRACEYYNDFFNDMFRLLFLGESKDVFAKL